MWELLPAIGVREARKVLVCVRKALSPEAMIGCRIAQLGTKCIERDLGGGNRIKIEALEYMG